MKLNTDDVRCVPVLGRIEVPVEPGASYLVSSNHTCWLVRGCKPCRREGLLLHAGLTLEVEAGHHDKLSFESEQGKERMTMVTLARSDAPTAVPRLVSDAVEMPVPVVNVAPPIVNVPALVLPRWLPLVPVLLGLLALLELVAMVTR